MKAHPRIALALTMLASAPAAAQLADKKTLTLEGAKKVVAAATTEARRLGLPAA